MTHRPDYTSDKRQIINALFIPSVIAVFMILSLVLEKGMEWDFHRAGIYPRNTHSLWGILTFAFVHGDWGHLANNVISFVVLGGFLFYFYRQIAMKVLLISYFASGMLLWLIGRDSWHIGASGWIYALAFFLFFSGIIRQYVPLIAISLVVALNYGNMIWHIFPWEIHDPISWEGHLSGAVIGLVLAAIYRRQGPQKPIKEWEDEEEDDGIEYIEGDEETDNLPGNPESQEDTPRQ